MARAGSLLWVAIAAIGSGCAGATAAHAPARAQAAEPSVAAARCPMSVPGAQVAAGDAPGGAAMTFRTSVEAVADLRSRVRAMADVHNRPRPGDAIALPVELRDGGTAGGSTGSAAAAAMEGPPSRAFVEDLLDGARLTLTPYDPADLERLRAAVRARAEHMRATGACEGADGSGAPHG